MEATEELVAGGAVTSEGEFIRGETEVVGVISGGVRTQRSLSIHNLEQGELLQVSSVLVKSVATPSRAVEVSVSQAKRRGEVVNK